MRMFARFPQLERTKLVDLADLFACSPLFNDHRLSGLEAIHVRDVQCALSWADGVSEDCDPRCLFCLARFHGLRARGFPPLTLLLLP